MSNGSSSHIAKWSTDEVPDRDRLDFWESVLSSSVMPVLLSEANPNGFESRMSLSNIGAMTVARQRGSPHIVGRGRSELSRSSARSFNILVSLNEEYNVTAGKGRLRIAPGDVLLLDSERPFILELEKQYEFINISVPPELLGTWVDDFESLIECSLTTSSRWGRSFGSYLALLAPRFGQHLTLSDAAISDHIGSMFALISREMNGNLGWSAGEKSLLADIERILSQRFQESSLEATDVAASAKVSVRTLHRCLQATGKTFSGLLLDARVKCAVRMLQSPLFSKMTVAHVGIRSGFLDSSHLSRAVRQKTGYSPVQIRSMSLGLAPDMRAAQLSAEQSPPRDSSQ